jgi:hypothetical protein
VSFASALSPKKENRNRLCSWNLSGTLTGQRGKQLEVELIELFPKKNESNGKPISRLSYCKLILTILGCKVILECDFRCY